MAFPEIAAGGFLRRIRGLCARAATTGHAWAVICGFSLIFAGGLFAQDAGQNPALSLESSNDQNTIRGTVVNSVTHLPIARALVHSADDHFAVMSDSDGHFEFTAPTGIQVWLLARKPGFLGDRNTGRAMQGSSGH